MNVEELVLRIKGDSTSAVAALAVLQAKLVDAQKDLKNVAEAATHFGEVGQKALGTELQTAGEKVAGLKGEISQLKNAMHEAAPAAKPLETVLNNLGAAATRLGVTLSAVLTAPLAGAAAAAVHFGAEFQTEMTKVVTLAGASRAEVDSLEKKVLDLGPAVGVGPAELAKGLFVIESAGFKGAAAMDVLTIAGKMTALGMGTTEETARSLIGVMYTYTSQHISAAEAADILTKTVQLGNMKINDLVPALARVNPLAAALGVRFQDIAAGIATFTHMGASSEVAATGMRAMLSNILNDSAKTEKGFKALSLALGDSSISMENFRKEMKDRGFTEAMIDLMTKVNAAGDAGISALNKIFPNIKALTVAMGDYIAQGGLVVNIHNELEHSLGTLATSTAELHKTWQFQWDALKAQMDNVWIALSRSLVPELEKLVDLMSKRIVPAFQEAVDLFNTLPEPLKLAAFAAAGVAAAMGPLLVIGGQLAMGMAALVTTFGTGGVAAGLTGVLGGAAAALGEFGIALAALATGPVGLTVLALTAVGAALVELTGGWAHAKSAVSETWDGIKTGAEPVKAAIGDVTAIIRDMLIMTMNKFTDAIGAAWKEFKAFASWAKDGVKPIGDAIDWLAEKEVRWLFPIEKALKQWEDLKAQLSSAASVLGGFRQLMDLEVGVTKAPGAPAGAPSGLPSLKLAYGEMIAIMEAATIATDESAAAIRRRGQAHKQTTEEGKAAIEAAKDHAKALDAITGKLDGEGLIKKAGLYVEALGRISGLSELSSEKQRDVAKTMEDAMAVYRRAGLEVPNAWKLIAMEARATSHTVDEETRKQIEAMQRAMAPFGKFASSVPVDPKFEDNTWATRTTLKGRQVPGVTGMVPGIDTSRLPGGGYGNLAPKAGPSLLSTLFGTSQEFGAQMSQTIIGALQGGGNPITAAAGTVGSTVATNFTSSMAKSGSKLFTGALGSVFGAALPVVGSLIGPLAEKIWGTLFGTAGRDKVKDFAAGFGGFDELHKKLNALGGAGEQLWKNLTQGVGRNNPKEAQAAIEAINKALNSQTSETQLLVDTASKYGLTWKEAGESAKTAHLDEIAQGLIADFARLTKGGYDVVAVEEHMAKSVNDYVKDAIAMGREVPEAMRPMLEEMAKNGQLLDANGEKITDLDKAGISFAKSMTAGFKDVTGAINRLGDILLGLPNTAMKAADGINTALGTIKDRKVTLRYVAEGGDGAGGAGTEPIPSFSHRAMEAVTRAGLAMVHPGDYVGVPPAGGLAPASIAARGGVTVAVTNYIDRPIFKDREAMHELAVELGKQFKDAITPNGMW